MNHADSGRRPIVRTDEHSPAGIPGTPERERVTSERNPQPCGAPINVRFAVRTCAEPDGHDGYHITTDSQGRPEYFWASTR